MRSLLTWFAVFVLILTGTGPSRAEAVPIPPKEQAEQLVKVGVPLARKMIAEHREFRPFGLAISKSDKMLPVAAKLSEDHPAAQKVIARLEESFRAGAAAGEYQATALFSEVRVPRPGKSEKIDAIQVSLEHVAGYCVDVFFPYSRGADGKVSLGDTFASKRVGVVFPACK